MTGLDPARHVIVEIATLITDDDLAVLAEGPDLVVHAEPSQLDAMEPVVREMHTRSGLLGAIESSTLSLDEAGRQTLEFLKSHVPAKGSVPLCGNSIGTDRRFLAAQLPEIENWLHYRSVDVSTIKELCRRWYPGVLAKAPDKKTSHRALDDMRESVAELAYYRAAIFVSPTPPAPAVEPAGAVPPRPRPRRLTPTAPRTTERTTMDHHTLGRTGMRVSPLCLGAMMFGAWGNPDHDDCVRIVHAALDAGYQLHRHRRRLLGRGVRGDRGQVPGRRTARWGGPRHQGPCAHGCRSQHAGELAPLDHARSRVEPTTAAHRLDRPVPDPPARPHLRHRRHPGRAVGPGAPGQGAGHRLLDVPRRPHRRIPLGGRATRARALRVRTTPVLDPDPSGGVRPCCRPVSATGWA